MYYNVVKPVVVVETNYPKFADADIREFPIPAQRCSVFRTLQLPAGTTSLPDNIVEMNSRRPSKQVSVS